MPDSRKVFVIHGRDERLRKGMFDFLRSLDLAPLEWSEAVALTQKAAPYVGEILDAAFSHAQAVVVILSPDDEARLRTQLHGADEPSHERNLTPQARPNVLFEAGMAMARHPERTVLAELGKLRPFSDVGGRHTIRMDNSTQKRQDLAQRLQQAGCPVNLKGIDWQSAGDLIPPQLNLTTSTNITPLKAPVQAVAASPNDVAEHLRELISEMENNLTLAREFESNGHLKKPSTAVWRAFKDEFSLPEVLKVRLSDAYKDIEAWRNLLDGGYSLGGLLSTKYGALTTNARHDLPYLIEKLKKLLP